MFMSKRKGFSGLIMLTVALVMLLSGCGGQTSTEAPGTAKSGSGSGPVLKIGVDDVYPPMEFKDEKGDTVGFDVDLANAIGEKLNRKVEFVSIQWDGIFTGLKSQKYDCIISSVSINEERLAEYAFTDPYIANAQVIVVGKNNTSIKSEKDLAGKNVGVQVGTTADESAEKFLKETTFNLKKYEQIIQPFADLKVGRIDAIIVDEVVARYYEAQESSIFKVTGGRLTNEPIGICFRKDEESTILRDNVQTAINTLKAEGKLKEISQKWFGEDMVSNIQ